MVRKKIIDEPTLSAWDYGSHVLYSEKIGGKSVQTKLPKGEEYKRQSVWRGLGDRTQQLLTSLGYTQKRHIAIKVWFGFSHFCRCTQRVERFNRFGGRVGRAVRAFIEGE